MGTNGPTFSWVFPKGCSNMGAPGGSILRSDFTHGHPILEPKVSWNWRYWRGPLQSSCPCRRNATSRTLDIMIPMCFHRWKIWERNDVFGGGDHEAGKLLPYGQPWIQIYMVSLCFWGVTLNTHRELFEPFCAWELCLKENWFLIFFWGKKHSTPVVIWGFIIVIVHEILVLVIHQSGFHGMNLQDRKNFTTVSREVVVWIVLPTPLSYVRRKRFCWYAYMKMEYEYLKIIVDFYGHNWAVSWVQLVG